MNSLFGDRDWLTPSYRKYIRSSAWKKKRQAALNYRGNACEKCGAHGLPGGSATLQVDHLNYDRLGEENIATDLQILCMPCHVKVTENRDLLRSVNFEICRRDGFLVKRFGEDYPFTIPEEDQDAAWERFMRHKGQWEEGDGE